ncbi:MAG TPA: PH domain-containing protein [Phycisphaerales bacterium]|nr:PH domain-containing protein [Phycisphaerales bacterium]
MQQISTARSRELLQEGEIIILLLRPSLLYIPLSCFGGLIFILLITFALAYISRIAHALPSVTIGWTDRQAFSLGIGLFALRLGWQVLEWFSRIYILTDRRIITRSGVLRVNVFQTSLKNIQHTSVIVRLRERIFGLGCIAFATAGSDVFDSFWVVIRRPFVVHRKIVDTIRRYSA